MTRAGAARGFTLIEVMIALLIFGLIAAAGVALLSVSVRAQAAAQARLDEIGALSRLTALLEADLAQARDRPVRDAAGVPLPAFIGERDGAARPALALVRAGWTNLDGAPRADLQRVEYRLSGEAIERQALPMVDGAPPLPPTPLLRGVTQLGLRYRRAGAWSDRWQAAPDAPLPDAVEVQIAARGGRRWRALFLVGTGYAPPLPAGGPLAP